MPSKKSTWDTVAVGKTIDDEWERDDDGNKAMMGQKHGQQSTVSVERMENWANVIATSSSLQ